MFQRKSGRILVALLVFTLIVIGAVVTLGKTGVVVAQGPPPPPPQGPPPPGAMAPMGPGAAMMAGGMMRGGASVAANADNVFAVQGGVLYSFSAKGLKLVDQTQLPRPTAPTGGQGGGGMRGGGASVAANADTVFVIQGGILYSFSAKGLKLIDQTQLPRPTPPAPAGGN